RRDLVAGDLLAEEAVVGLVGVEAGHDVIAVTPGVGPWMVALVALRFRPAGEVEPVTAPAFAVVGRRQQPVHKSLVGVGRRVVDGGVDLLRRRRQPGQVERQPADEDAARRFGGGGEAVGLVLLGDEGVDGVADPGGVLSGGYGGPADGAGGPVAGGG